MDDDETGIENDERLPKRWSDFSPGRLKQDIEEAWQTRPPGSGPYEVVIQVEGSNPISGYGVIVRPG